ncbi:MAG: hypothetical protein MK226_18410 [Saprospiraceae bacterium]|nr:hypothetical protein [Saprospiraceae bacterium]
MKKITTRTVIVVMLIVASLCSYIYLNTMEVSTPMGVTTEQLEEQELSGTTNEMVLPDVKILERILESGKRLLPTSKL